MIDDADLLRRFVESGSESAFNEFVRRNTPLVYHAALRRTGGRTDLAEEVSQYVFTTVAHNAPQLLRHVTLAGWLFTTTRLAAYRILRDDRRRRDREQKFALMTDLMKPEAQAHWEKLRPELDMLLDQLSAADREAVLLRYIQGHSLAEVGATLGLNPDSARKRIERAVDRLRSVLVKRGLKTSGAVIAELLAAEAGAAAPVQLAERLACVALKHAIPASSSAAATAIGGSVVALSGAAVAGLTIAIMAAGSGFVLYSIHAAHTARAELAAMSRSVRAAEMTLASARQGRGHSSTSGGASGAMPAGPASAAAASTHAGASDLTNPTEAADARANGARFLSAVPEARTRLTSFELTQLRATFAGFYRAAGLTPEEIDVFERRFADYHLSAVELSGNRMVTTAGDLPVDQVRAMLGNERGATYEKYLPEIPARRLALEAAATINYTAASTTPAQVDQLTRVLADANLAYQTSGKVDLGTEDWSVALPRVQALLTPEQWNAAQGLFLGQAYEQALRKAQAAASTNPLIGHAGGPSL